MRFSINSLFKKYNYITKQNTIISANPLGDGNSTKIQVILKPKEINRDNNIEQGKRIIEEMQISGREMIHHKKHAKHKLNELNDILQDKIIEHRVVNGSEKLHTEMYENKMNNMKTELLHHLEQLHVNQTVQRQADMETHAEELRIQQHNQFNDLAMRIWNENAASFRYPTLKKGTLTADLINLLGRVISAIKAYASNHEAVFCFGNIIYL